MRSVLIGCVGALVSGTLGALSVLTRLPAGEHLKIRKYPRIVWLHLLLILVGTLTSILVLLIQGRSGTKAEARLVQLQAEQARLTTLAFKQEVVHSIELEIDPHQCPLESELKAGSIERKNLSRLRLLSADIVGRPLKSTEVPIIQIAISYDPLWIVLVGEANETAEKWFYSIGAEAIRPGARLRLAPFPHGPNAEPLQMVELKLNQGHIGRFITNPPAAGSLLGGPRSSVFDPRFELGFMTVTAAGLLRGPTNINLPPPDNFVGSPLWAPMTMQVEDLNCWDVWLTINGRRVTNLMNPAGLLTEQRERILHWPGAIIDPKLRRGLVWLAPMPYDWREFRPLMASKLVWLVYSEGPKPN